MKKGKLANGTLWLMIAAGGLFTIVSCNKNNSPVITHGLIKSITVSQSNTNGSTVATIYTISAGYDSENRFTSIIENLNTAPGRSITSVFSYSGNTAMETTIYNDGAHNQESTKYYLNSQGYADSSLQLFDCNPVTKYTYNAMDYLVSLEQTDTCGEDLQIAYTYNSSGDVDTQTSMNYGSTNISTYTYNYLSGHTWPDLVINVCNPYSLQPNFLGMKNNKMWTQEVQTYGANSTPSTITATYQFDSQGRVSTINTNDGTITTTMVYTYW